MIDLISLYRFRDELTLFECVALAHGYIPRDLSDYAVQALWEKLYRAGDPELFSQCIDSHPEWAFPPEVAETASALKIMASAGSLAEELTVDDCRQWLAVLGLSLPWLPSEHPHAKAPAPDGWRFDRNSLKSQKQDRAILAAIETKGFDPLAIPDGEKGTIEALCTLEYPELFTAATAFETAWKRGLKAGHWRMQSHASYAKRGKG